MLHHPPHEPPPASGGPLLPGDDPRPGDEDEDEEDDGFNVREEDGDDGDWKAHARRLLGQQAASKEDTARKRRRLGGFGLWRCIIRLCALPWTAMILVAVAIALISVFIVFIVNGQTNTASNVSSGSGSTNNASTTNLITIQCSTDLTEEECDQRVQAQTIAGDYQQAMTETHLFTTLLVFWIAATIFFIIKAIRVRKRMRYLESLPLSSISVWSDLNPAVPAASAQPLSPGGTSGGAASAAVTSSTPTPTGATQLNFPFSPAHHSQTQGQQPSQQQQHQTASATGGNANAAQLPLSQHQPPNNNNNPPVPATTAAMDTVSAGMAHQIPVHDEMEHSITWGRWLHTIEPYNASGDPSWATFQATGSEELVGTHFPTTVQLSYHHLQAAAMAYDASLAIPPTATIREYCQSLKETFPPPHLSHHALDHFVDLYERARFSNLPVGEAEWRACMRLVYTLVFDFEQLKRMANRPGTGGTSAPPPVVVGQSTSVPDGFRLHTPQLQEQVDRTGHAPPPPPALGPLSAREQAAKRKTADGAEEEEDDDEMLRSASSSASSTAPVQPMAFPSNPMRQAVEGAFALDAASATKAPPSLGKPDSSAMANMKTGGGSMRSSLSSSSFLLPPSASFSSTSSSQGFFSPVSPLNARGDGPPSSAERSLGRDELVERSHQGGEEVLLRTLQQGASHSPANGTVNASNDEDALAKAAVVRGSFLVRGDSASRRPSRELSAGNSFRTALETSSNSNVSAISGAMTGGGGTSGASRSPSFRARAGGAEASSRTILLPTVPMDDSNIGGEGHVAPERKRGGSF